MKNRLSVIYAANCMPNLYRDEVIAINPYITGLQANIVLYDCHRSIIT
jgi:hypothetical protein